MTLEEQRENLQGARALMVKNLLQAQVIAALKKGTTFFLCLAQSKIKSRFRLVNFND